MVDISATQDTADADPALAAHSGRLRTRDARVDPADGIGRRLAAYRAQRGVRVSDLARSAGVSASLVSQIERGQSRPSVSTLFAFAEALDLPVDAFFREMTPGVEPVSNGAVGRSVAHQAAAEPASSSVSVPTDLHEARYVVRRADRATIEIESDVRWERLTPGPLNNVEFLELVYGPGAESSSALYRHTGEEMILILAGELDIYIGFECYHLRTGDSMHFPSMLPHRYVNPTDQTTRAVTTILHDGDWYGARGAGHGPGAEHGSAR
ncbi:helix-turn-helix domain-containing protein [Solwaraspora sp. WMMB335]|uniref:helix-turn-helix domain-containing protein n=1 Tax=Solwaraspora sp. WMMB335 TaxID=3404118 RepID=UPI003B95C69B